MKSYCLHCPSLYTLRVSDHRLPFLASHPPVIPFLWRTICSHIQPMRSSQPGTMAWHVCNPVLVVEQIHPEIDVGSKHQTVGNAQNVCRSSRERGPLFLAVLLRHLGSEANTAAWHPCRTLESFQVRKMLLRLEEDSHPP